MISAKPIAMVAMLLLAGGAVAQERADKQRIAELIGLLQDDAKGNRAFHELVSFGEPAARELVRQIERGRMFSPVFRALAELAEHATGSYGLFMDSVADCPPEALPSLFRAIYSLVPYLPRTERNAIVYEVTTTAVAVRNQTDPGILRDALAEEIHRGGEIDLYLNRLVVDSESSLETLIDALWEGPDYGNMYKEELAAEFLGRMGPEATLALPSLVERMRLPVLRTLAGSEGFRYDVNPRSHVPYAEAILQIGPTGPEAVGALVYLAWFGDSYQKSTSIEKLRMLGDSAALATHALVRTAETAATKNLRFEAITTLGIIGAPAIEAIPALDRLSRHDDRQFAERAKAALRQISPSFVSESNREPRGHGLLDRRQGWSLESVLTEKAREHTRRASQARLAVGSRSEVDDLDLVGVYRKLYEALRFEAAAELVREYSYKTLEAERAFDLPRMEGIDVLIWGGFFQGDKRVSAVISIDLDEHPDIAGARALASRHPSGVAIEKVEEFNQRPPDVRRELCEKHVAARRALHDLLRQDLPIPALIERSRLLLDDTVMWPARIDLSIYTIGL